MKISLLAVTLLAVANAAIVHARPSSASHPQSLGKPCTSSSQCMTAYCGYARCAAKQAVGKACYKDAGCVSGVCKKSKCVAKTASGGGSRAIGRACTASTQCASGLCEHSKCAAKKTVGGACYKDVACQSGYCKDGKTCASRSASTTATSTSTSTATTTTTTSVVTPAAQPALVDGDFTSLDAYQTSGSGSAVIVNDAATCNTGNTCVRVTIPAGGDFSIIQTLSPRARRRRALAPRQNAGPHFVSNVYRKVTAMSPIGVFDLQVSGLNANPDCNIAYCMNGDCSYGDTIFDVDADWTGGGGGANYDATLTSIGVKLTCEPGAQMTVLIDSLSFIDLVEYASLSSAGIKTETGFLTPTSPSPSQPSNVSG